MVVRHIPGSGEGGPIPGPGGICAPDPSWLRRIATSTPAGVAVVVANGNQLRRALVGRRAAIAMVR